MVEQHERTAPDDRHSSPPLSPSVPGNGPGDDELPAPRLALTILLVALACISGAALLSLSSREHSRGELVLQTVLLLVLPAIQLMHCAPMRFRWGRRCRINALVVQAALTYLPFLVLGESWVGVPGFLAGSILLTLSGVLSSVLAACVPLSMLVICLGFGHSAAETAYVLLSTFLTGMIVYGLTRLSDMVVAMKSTQAEMARMVVARERLRFARDLHDLLGYSLSAITLRSELTYRLVDTHPDRAREEIAAVLDISRRALADVREVARGYRNMSLHDEAASAKSVLEAAGVGASVEVSCGDLPGQVSTVLATVLREGMTNVLRHSRVQRCWIRIWTQDGVARLRIVNDGVSRTADLRERPPHSGSGLGNLRSRLTSVGGLLEAGPEGDGRFRLMAAVPLHLDEVQRKPAESAASGARSGKRTGSAA